MSSFTKMFLLFFTHHWKKSKVFLEMSNDSYKVKRITLLHVSTIYVCVFIEICVCMSVSILYVHVCQ